MKDAGVHIYHTDGKDTCQIQKDKKQVRLAVPMEFIADVISELVFLGYNLTFCDHYDWEVSPEPTNFYIIGTCKRLSW